MKRFHVHVAVADLADSIRFYATIFGQAPTVEKPDYAKWMLEDPRVNFAISRQDTRSGLDHLGFQVESADELKGLQAQLAAADAGLVTEENAACCYARSDKYWVTDPAGIAWETFHTLGTVPVFGEDRRNGEALDATACCTPAVAQQGEQAQGACCGPQAAPAKAAAGCCG